MGPTWRFCAIDLEWRSSDDCNITRSGRLFRIQNVGPTEELHLLTKRRLIGHEEFSYTTGLVTLLFGYVTCISDVMRKRISALTGGF